MSESNEMVPVVSEEYEAFLPDGWGEGDDIFDVASWTGSSGAADESQTNDGQEEVNETDEAGAEEAPAIEQNGESEEPGNTGEEVPATEQKTGKAKLKFSTQIDHKIEDVELDENDLPTIYQKAHVTDRVKAKLAQSQPLIDKGNKLAKILGYATMDEMLDAAESAYKQGEIDRLTEEGVHPDVAQELVENRTQKAIASVSPETFDADGNAPRDFRAEVADLLKTHPELRGTQLPEEVVKACVVEGRALSSAYEAYARKKTEAENRAVKAENKKLKQNADAARRAPVRGVSKGGATNPNPDDPFLAGFNSDRW